MAAKKDNLPTKPIVSRVPLPVSDSALVIDLPDGQKLVIGKMSQGTVIEVATWRGVGRPDSRTNRMMFGMSTAEIEEEADNSGGSSQVALQPESLVTKIINYPMAIVKWLFNIQSVPTVKRNGKERKRLIIEPTVGETSAASAVSNVAGSENRTRVRIDPAKVLSTATSALKKIDVKRFKDLKKVRNLKGIGKLSRPQSSPAPTSDDLEIDTWLASITAKSNKKLSLPPSESVAKKGSKK